MTRMFKRIINHKYVGVIFLSVIFTACAPTIVSQKENSITPENYNYSQAVTTS
jgi:hypothetical protein